MKKRMIAKNERLIKGIVHEGNTIEVKIALNEFANYLHLKTGSTDAIKNCLFWLDWITYYNKLYKKTHGRELKCVELYNHSNIDPKYKDNVIWYIWDIIFNILDRVETRYTGSAYRYLRESVENLYSLYVINVTKGNMNGRVVYIKYAILLIKKDIGTSKYKNVPNHLDEVCVKACANVNDLYRFLLGNRFQYECHLKEEAIMNEIKSVPKRIITEEEEYTKVQKAHNREVANRQVSEYLKNRKFGKERVREEIQRLQDDQRTSYERYIDNLNVIDRIRREGEKDDIHYRKLYEQLQKEKQNKLNEERRILRIKRQERMRRNNSKNHTRRMYRNILK